MPDKETLERAREDQREGKSPSTQAGEFVREEIHHVREGKHGVRNAKQAIAIGLSKARKAGIDLPPANGRGSSKKTSKRKSESSETARTRSRATTKALKKEGHSGASRAALSKHARGIAKSAGSRSKSARKAAATRARSSASSRNRAA